jgi:15-cis-phytoene desaturase
MLKVVIIGGGIAGLSAAQELAERGFSVAVYERANYVGGKARSISKAGSGLDGRRDLPGEHGFRFFPGFYRHVTDTMARIPLHNSRTVFDELVNADKATVAQVARQAYTFPTRLPRLQEGLSSVIESIQSWCESIADLSDLGLSKREAAFFAGKMIDFLTTSESRRMAELEQLPWMTYTQAGRMSEQYGKLLAIGLTRSLVAMKAEVANTRTVGSILVQMVRGMLLPAADMDRVLAGPTEDVWITPWISHLTSLGVSFHLEHRATAIDFDRGKVNGIKLLDSRQKEITVSGDFYICAVPVEIAVGLISPAMRDSAPSLARIDELQVSWMNGIQFFLNRDVTIVRGHVICADSPWALTCISQPQFWSNIDLDNYGDGRVKGIISVDISNWTEPGISKTKKPAQDCSAEEIMQESWAQLLEHFSHSDDPYSRLRDEDLVTWFLDPDILFPPQLEENEHVKSVLSQSRGLRSVRHLSLMVETLKTAGVDKNIEPLLINTVGSWTVRPEAKTEIPNFFLAGDYVRTFTDLATMEGANEAGRRAVNAILDRLDASGQSCTLFPLEEPAIFRPAKALDEILFRFGLPHVSIAPVIGLGVPSRRGA